MKKVISFIIAICCVYAILYLFSGYDYSDIRTHDFSSMTFTKSDAPREHEYVELEEIREITYDEHGIAEDYYDDYHRELDEEEGYLNTIEEDYNKKVSCEGKCGDNVKWQIKGDTLFISGTGDMYNYPKDKKQDWEKYAIENDTGLNLCVLPGVTSIGDYTFYDCSIVCVRLCNTLKKIGKYAFYSNYIPSVAIPDSVTEIGSYAFYATCLKHVRLSTSLTEISSNCFRNNTELKEIVIPEGVTTIKKRAFENCGLLRVSFPSTLETIGDYAFNNCKGYLIFPDTVKHIGKSAFSF